jgi:hypothetical protein
MGLGGIGEGDGSDKWGLHVSNRRERRRVGLKAQLNRESLFQKMRQCSRAD